MRGWRWSATSWSSRTEIYEKLVFGGAEHVSLAALDGMPDRTVTVNGFSKAYAMTGWRVGYLAAPAWLVEAATEIKHTLSICTPPALQRGALAALKSGDEAVASMLAEYERRLELVLRRLDDMGISYGCPGGGMYVYANIASTGLDAETFCLELLRREQVMVFPGTMFADPANRHIRITLLSPYESMQRALTRMGRFVERARAGVNADPTRVVLVGAGVRGRIWARVIAEAPEATLAGIVDRDGARAGRARDDHAPQAAVHHDLASALADANADPDIATAAVVIATPPASHHTLVSRALAHGLHVLCGKAPL